MAGELAVELSDLNAWAAQVGRAGGHATGLEEYARTHVADGDFGAILEMITGDYEALLPQFHNALGTDGSRLSATGATLRAVSRDFRRTDERVAQEFGPGAAITDDGSSGGAFQDAGTVRAAAPSSGGEQLPEVSFGWILDKACELITWVGGPDPREYVTKWIAGDLGKASLQASAWEHASECLRAVEANLSRGSAAIGRTWTGEAATSSSAYLDQWLTSLGDQSLGMAQVAEHLRDMIRQALDMAQVVVDIIKLMIDTILAGLSCASIPIYGQIKLVDKVRDAIKLLNDARKVLTVFWDMVRLIKDGIVMVAHSFSVDALPAEPAVPAAA